MDIKVVLKEFGLSEAETRMYLAGLKTGEAPLAHIAALAKIKRGSAYLVAKNLKKRGLMGSFKMSSGLVFVVSPPATIASQAKRLSREIEEIIPKLNVLKKGSTFRPEIEVYEGREGYLTVFEDSLNMYNGTIRAIGSLEQFYEVITYDYDNQHYIPERVRRKIKFKGLYFKDEAVAKFSKSRDAEELRQMRYMPSRYFQPTFTLIYRNTIVVFTTKKEKLAVKITSEDLTKSEKARFDLIWDLAGDDIG